ncbi:hypothetical protein [Rubrivirga sp. IMCC45206]|uniref:hypothetical protein n=1 Tax=Rubrivirga sp. IMCC45206 TaxID=3391614 RepID=UPI00398F96E4
MSPTLSPALDRALAAHEAATDRSGAHLADAAFRFAAAAPAVVSTRPIGLSGDEWTLAQTLGEIRIRRARVVRSTRGLKVRHAHRLPELDRAVRRHARAVGLWLDLGQPAPADGWDDATALRLAWLRERLGDPTGLVLRPAETIADGPRFLMSVATRIEAGPTAPSADSVRRDLADLFDRHARTAKVPAGGRAPARAA